MNRKRNNQIVIRLSDEENEMLKRKVEQSGKTQQEFLISMLINGTVTNTDGVKELFPEVKRIGNNLNQIARSCNSGNQATLSEVQKVGEEMNGIWRLLKQFLQKRT